MNWDSLFQIIVLLGSGGVLSVAAKALVDRKKIRVDSVAILSDTAMKQADNAQKVADKAQARVDDLEEGHGQAPAVDPRTQLLGLARDERTAPGWHRHRPAARTVADR
ncbi:hypothetical protein GS489_07630 [Rhodococcus hoagii]|nr:hypothetical protein [Prescottella equi]